MNEAEATSLVIEYLALAHGYGEAFWGRADLWVGISSGVILVSHFAPERLNPRLAGLLVALYVFFTFFLMSSVVGDLRVSFAAITDAKALIEKYDLSTTIVEARMTVAESGFFSVISFFGAIFGLFIGTIGYVVYVARKHYLSDDT